MSATLEKYELKYPAPAIIESDDQNDQYTAKLIELKKRGRLSAEDREYARLLATLIEKYESERFPIPDATPQEILAELIEQNGLRQRDLVPILGPESVVSEIVNGKRPLSKTHIEKLSQRFHVSPAVFFPKIPARSVHQTAARKRRD
jgi:HTH-type transcriptional regulator / antitoxin HigA